MKSSIALFLSALALASAERIAIKDGCYPEIQQIAQCMGKTTLQIDNVETTSMALKAEFEPPSDGGNRRLEGSEGDEVKQRSLQGCMRSIYGSYWDCLSAGEAFLYCYIRCPLRRRNLRHLKKVTYFGEAASSESFGPAEIKLTQQEKKELIDCANKNTTSKCKPKKDILFLDDDDEE